ncbi:MAG TPA: xanthine dehydrogenase family protein molybdopterin-binding subunit [Thermoleophilaceae bacterium]
MTQTAEPALGAVGVRRPRLDGEAKVRGGTRYAADVPVPGLLHARLVQSTEAHARVDAIDASAALELPGVVAVLTADDLPIAEEATGRAAEPLARGEVVFSGQPVALVLAESEAAAADGAALVVVDYEPLPVVLDMEAAMAPDSPLARLEGGVEESDVGDAHAAVGGGDEEEAPAEDLSGNVSGRQRLAQGDADAAFAGSDVRASGRFVTPRMYQAYLEPQTATAWLEPDGELVLNTSTQGAFPTRQNLSTLFGLPFDRIRVRPAPLGGAFGGKLMVIEPLVAGATLALRRPVRLAMTRFEDFTASNPAPGQVIELEAGARSDGTLTAVRGRVICDQGGNCDFGIGTISALLSSGPYRWEARDITGYDVATNRVGTGAYRAPGAPPAAFAIEALIDDLAGQLGVDPIELRLQNMLHEGDPGPDGGPFPVFGGTECLERVRDHPLWQRRNELPENESVGVGIGWWPGGLEPAAAACRLDSDGGVTIVTGAVDMSGTENAFAAIAAEAFGLPLERVRVVAADTSSGTYAGMSGGSKVTYTVGAAVERAAREAREQLLRVASSEMEIAPEDLEIVDGKVQPVGAPAQARDVTSLAKEILRFGGQYEPVEGHGRTAQTSRAPGAAAHLSHVRVHRDTGEVELLAHVIAQDVGRALNPDLVEGQMQGGAAQGIGWALMEAMGDDDSGQPTTASFVGYAVPTVDRVPPIDCEVVEVPAPDGPFGAKGVGEPPVVGVPAAVANAVAAATGVRVYELPLTSERVWSALESASA